MSFRKSKKRKEMRGKIILAITIKDIVCAQSGAVIFPKVK